MPVAPTTRARRAAATMCDLPVLLVTKHYRGSEGLLKAYCSPPMNRRGARMDLGSGLGHLSYSTLVHAGDTWPQMRASLAEFLPRVKARVAPDRWFGVSLRLSAASGAGVTARPDERAWRRR